MKRLIILWCFLLPWALNAQSPFFFRMGLTVLSVTNSQGDAFHSTSFTLGPGVRLIQNKKFGARLYTPISFGAGFLAEDIFKVYNYGTYDLPIVIDLLLGNIVVGGGYGHVGASDRYFESHSPNFFYQRFHAGVQLKTSNTDGSPSERAVILFSYGRSLSDSRSVYELSLQFTFNLDKKKRR